jgi:hypothetical protein
MSMVIGVVCQVRLDAADVHRQQQRLITPGVQEVLRPQSAALSMCISLGGVWLLPDSRDLAREGKVIRD